MEIDMFDVVELHDGRIGTVLEIFENPSEAFMIDLTNSEDAEEDIDVTMPIVQRSEIKKITYKAA